MDNNRLAMEIRLKVLSSRSGVYIVDNGGDLLITPYRQGWKENARQLFYVALGDDTKKILAKIYCCIARLEDGYPIRGSLTRCINAMRLTVLT